MTIAIAVAIPIMMMRKGIMGILMLFQTTPKSGTSNNQPRLPKTQWQRQRTQAQPGSGGLCLGKPSTSIGNSSANH